MTAVRLFMRRSMNTKKTLKNRGLAAANIGRAAFAAVTEIDVDHVPVGFIARRISGLLLVGDNYDAHEVDSLALRIVAAFIRRSARLERARSLEHVVESVHDNARSVLLQIVERVDPSRVARIVSFVHAIEISIPAGLRALHFFDEAFGA